MDSTSTKNLGFKAFSDLLSPELNQFITQNPGSIDGYIINKEQAELNWNHRTPTIRSTLVSGAPTAELVPCLTDCVSTVLLAAGIPKWRDIGEEIIADIPPEALNVLEKDVQTLEQATTMTDKVDAVFTIYTGIYRITGIRQILGVVKHHLSWYKWLLLKFNITTKLTAWVANDEISTSAKIAIYWAIVANETAKVLQAGAGTKSQ